MNMDMSPRWGWHIFPRANIYINFAPSGLTHKIRCGQKICSPK
jgi:hypothetical protein